MALNITSTYAGEVLDNFLMKVSTGNEAVEGGHVQVVENIVHKQTLPRIKAEDLFQDRAATPTSSGTITVNERQLQPADLMLYHEFNPRDFEDFWRPFQPTGPLVFRTLSPETQSAMLEEIIKYARNFMGTAIWQGDTSTAPSGTYRYFNGLITRASADADVIDIASPVTLTSGNIQAKVAAVYDAVPAAVRRDPNFKIFMSDKSGELYVDAVHAQANKGNDFTQGAPMTYKGKRVVSLVGMPDDTIFATIGSAGRDSNLYLGIDWDAGNMENALVIDKVSPASELYFIKALMKADTQIGWGEQCVLYKV